MKPIDLLVELADNVLLYHIFPKQGKPGEFIARLPEEQRHLLRELKSDDMKQLRSDTVPPWVMICNEHWGRRNGKLYDYKGRVVVRLNLP